VDGDGRGGEGGGVFDIFGGGGAGGGDGGGGGGDVGGGWRRASSARGRIPAAGEANPAAGTRHEESNLEPRQLGAAGADHHRGRGAQPPCQAAPPHRQTGQATAERAAQRRQPNGGVRPGGPTADSLICAADLPNSGTAPPMVQPESPAALLTCLGRHTAARPPAADGSPTYPESGPADAPGDLRFGCPEPCTRQANPPEHQGPISDFQASKRARCAGRPDFGLGGRRPQVQNLGRDRLRPFGRGRGWGKVSRPPPWKRANLATRRARGGAMACSAVGRRTGRDPRIRQTNSRQTLAAIRFSVAGRVRSTYSLCRSSHSAGFEHFRPFGACRTQSCSNEVEPAAGQACTLRYEERATCGRSSQLV